MDNPDAWPPLAVVRVEGILVCVDGFHRGAAALNLALESVRVRFHEMPSMAICALLPLI